MRPSIPSRYHARTWLIAAACCVVALVAAVANARGLRLAPPFIGSGSLQIAGASAQAALDLPHANVLSAGDDKPQLDRATRQTLLLAEVASTPPVLARIAVRAGIPARALSAATSFVSNIPEQMLYPSLEVRGAQIIASRARYHLDFQPDPNLPRIQIYAQAPTPAAADRLADAAVPGLQDFLASDVAGPVDAGAAGRLRELGHARGGVLNSSAQLEIFGLTFMLVLALCAAVAVGGARVRRGWARAARETSSTQPPARVAEGTARTSSAHGLGDWPRTTRPLPWMLAAFLFLLWLVPFDAIQLGGSSAPIDLKLDRLVLPVLALTWLMAVLTAGRQRPRVRLTWIHAGVFAFMAIAFLSFVVDSHYLNQTLHLSRGIKRLALLVAYVTLFVIVASGVRRSEVRAFLRYTLGLAVIAAFGTLVEYRFKYNVFYSLAHSLPGFHVSGQTFSSGVDDIGRRLVEGPADVPLEAVGMFAMALPIALAGLAEAKCWRPRITYGLAAALLLAASVSTERKSGLIGPAAVLLTFAVLRRRQAIRLLPLGALLVLVIHVAAPGALGGVSKQLAPSRLSVATVDVRVIRYDASRPDAWTHLALGQGYGTYDVRVLDNELLDRLLEGGVLGLGAYLLMLLAVMGVAFARARSRDPDDAMIGLVALSAAAGVLVLSATFDAMGFPHGPYIFLSLAGLLAAAVGGRRPAPEAETGPESRAASIGRASVPLSSSHPLRPPLRPVPVHGAVR